MEMNTSDPWMGNLPDWIAAGANVAVALGLLLAWLQLRLYRAEVRADHVRSARERAVDTIGLWAQNSDPKGSIARKLVEGLSPREIQKIVEQAPLVIDEADGANLSGVFAEVPEFRDGRYHLTVKHTSELRWIVISYLNRLEASLAGWRHGVSDEQIIEEQYAFLVNRGKGHHILANFRNALRTNSETDPYPAIEEFARKLDDRRSGRVPPPLESEMPSLRRARARNEQRAATRS